MLLTLLLDALGAIVEGEALLLLFKWLGIVLFLIVLPVGLILYGWSGLIGRQFEREPRETKSIEPTRQMRSAPILL